MIQITPQMRILVAIEPVDGRKGIDSLAQLCREKLAADPFSGCLFIFRSRSGTAIRLLAYDGQGFWLAHELTVFTLHLFLFQRSTLRGCLHTCRSISPTDPIGCNVSRVCPGPEAHRVAIRGRCRRCALMIPTFAHRSTVCS